MRYVSRAGLVVGLLLSASPVASAGDHLWWRYASTTTTTTTGTPSILAPASTPLILGATSAAPAPTLGAAAVPVSFNVLQPAAAPVSFAPAPTAAPTAYYYYYATVPQAAQSASPPTVETSILDAEAPWNAATPVNAMGQAAPLNPSGDATSPAGGQAGAGGGPRFQMLQRLRDSVANINSNFDRNELVKKLGATAKEEFPKILRAFAQQELRSLGLGFLVVPDIVPGSNEQKAIQELVDQVVNEKLRGGQANANGNPTFVFNGPVTLSFPNVQAVQIQAREVQQGGAAAGGDDRLSDAPFPTLAPATVPAAETPVPPAPSVPEQN